jgi:hypothetical protein
LRGCTLNKEKDCESAGFSHYKQSDKKGLGADAKIIIALRKEQPLRRVELCKKAGVSVSNFSRCRRLLLNEKVIKETSNGYCLSDFVERVTLWDKVQQDCLNANGHPVVLTLYLLELGERHPITGWYKPIYDKEFAIKGIMILKGAIELQKAASLTIPKEYSAFLLTQALVHMSDRLLWRATYYEIKDFDEVFDGTDLSYRIVKLVELPR